MPTLLERPPTSSARRRPRSVLSDTDDTRSIITGVLLTLILWPTTIALLWLALRYLGHSSSSRALPAPKPVYSIQLTQDEVPPEKKPPPDRFVETNPDAPENTPDKTRNFAARNQQVAQEKPTLDGKSDTPALSGKKPGEVTQIVNGQLNTTEEPPPPAPPPAPEVPPMPEQEVARREQIPLPGAEKVEGENKEGFGANLAKSPEGASAVPEPIQGQKNAPDVNGAATAGQPRIDPQRPQPRPRVARNVRPAVLVDNKFGTSNIGPVAIDARWSQYGEYLQKFIETVQVQWERILDQTHTSPPSGSTVTVKFRMDGKEGAIAEIISSESTGGTQAERSCISAITARSPYGKWPDDMMAVLGESQEMTFTFYYQ